MNRILLTLLLAVLTVSLSLAQVQIQKHNTIYQKLTDNQQTRQAKTMPNTQKDVATIWSCDFEEGCPEYFLTQGETSQVGWEIITESDYPEEMIRPNPREWYFTPMNYSGRSDVSGAAQQISETPAHWAFIDAGSDRFSTSPIVDANLTFTNIDLRDCSNPKISFLQSYKVLNQASETMTVSTSRDGGATWTDHIISNSGSSYQYFNGLLEVLIPEVAGFEEVQIRFNYSAYDPLTWHYGWQIDDIKIIENIDYDLSIQNARMNMFGYLDYRDSEYLASIWAADSAQGRRTRAYQFNDPIAVSPISQWESSNGIVAFNLEVKNNGNQTVTPMANIKVTSPSGAEVFNKTLTGASLNTSDIDTIDFELNNATTLEQTNVLYFAGLQQPEVGRYTVEFSVSSEGAVDGFESDNSTVQYFYISEKDFCTTYEEPATKTRVNSSTNSESGDEYGTRFDYYFAPDDIMSLDVFVAEGTTLGTAIQAKVYEFSEADEIWINKCSSEIRTITESMLNKWVNIEFEDEYEVIIPEDKTSNSVLVSLKLIFETDELIYLGSNHELPNFGHNNLGRPVSETSWYYGYDNMAINFHSGAMTFGGGNSGNDDNPDDAVESFAMSEISMYPNPTSSIVKFENVENASIEIINMMGQVVASENATSTSANISVEGLSDGNYVVRIVKEGVTSTGRLSIIR